MREVECGGHSSDCSDSPSCVHSLMSTGEKFLQLLCPDIHIPNGKLLSGSIVKGVQPANETKYSKAVVCL